MDIVMSPFSQHLSGMAQAGNNVSFRHSSRKRALKDRYIQPTRDSCPRDRRVGNKPDALARKIIDHRKDAEPSTASHGIGHKIEAPALVDALR